MKIFRRLSVALLLLLLPGCSSSDYRIIERSEGSMGKVVQVEVPANSTQSQLEGFARDLEGSEKVEGKTLMINFFQPGGTQTSNMLATYNDGSMSMTTAGDREESAKEGD